ncbi:MAG: acetylxylan esterase [Deltaproteobacteria bacterium]
MRQYNVAVSFGRRGGIAGALVVAGVLALALALAAPGVAWLPAGLPPAPAQGPALCVGACLSPEQGKAVLDAALARFPDRAAWAAYAEHVRQRVQQGAGLAPWPQRTALQAVVHGRRDYDGYSVENVFFESAPGNFVTGNLYRPRDLPPPYAAVISPHGHTKGALTKPEDYATQGRFEPGMQTRCANLARMGALVFAIDMFATGDSIQIVGGAAHKQPLALTIQTWNSLRTVDFLLSLPGVDPERVAVSGYSGGGTQTFLLAALDPRIGVSVPVAMVSSHHFGGCPCESGLPIHRSRDHFASNPMIAALMAPKPQLIVSDGGDWTQFTPQTEFPFLHEVYAYYGAEGNVANVHLPAEGHDYGPSKREATYRFLAQHLGLKLSRVLGADGKIDESHVTLEPPSALHVFDAEHPVPPQALHDAAAIQAVLRGLQH